MGKGHGVAGGPGGWEADWLGCGEVHPDGNQGKVGEIGCEGGGGGGGGGMAFAGSDGGVDGTGRSAGEVGDSESNCCVRDCWLGRASLFWLSACWHDCLDACVGSKLADAPGCEGWDAGMVEAWDGLPC